MTCDPQAWPEAQKILSWMRSLPARTQQRVIIGQQCPSWGDLNDAYYIDGVYRKTGRTPAMIGAGMHSGWKDSNLPPLYRHWNRGGLVTLEIHPSDPWRNGGEETAWVNRGDGAKPATAPKNDLRLLLDSAPNSAAKTKWQAQRNQLGDILTKLASGGVVVILRLFHEQNGSWFWWGQDLPTRKTAVVDLYRDTFNYLHRTRNLHNLLWSFSAAASWDGKVLQYYPGNDYCDILGPSRYHDTLKLLGPELSGEENHTDWTDYRRIDKPLGYTELGPDPTHNGTWDATTIMQRIRQNYRQMVFAHCWHGWDYHKLELVAQRNVKSLMRDPLAITLENIDWRQHP
jgi:mannan endo-1,4-beta-mannosidase